MSDASDDAEIRVICGPTAAGKSAVAAWLAAREPTVVISADSRQVYRGFDIGTAKPSREEQQRTPHWGIDVLEPTERYSAAAFADTAAAGIRDANASQRAPLVVGGTGLYLRALFDGLFAEPTLDPAARTALACELEQLGVTELRRWVTSIDPARAHLGRTQLLRAIEVSLLTGHRLSDLHRRPRSSRGWRPRYLLVDPGPALAGRIARRLDDMLDHGWPDEVTRLMQTVPPDAPAWNATGYDAVRRMVGGAMSRADAHETILIATRQYAKRQRTWFRGQIPAGQVTHVNPLDPDWTSVVDRWSHGHDGSHMSAP